MTDMSNRICLNGLTENADMKLQDTKIKDMNLQDMTNIV